MPGQDILGPFLSADCRFPGMKRFIYIETGIYIAYREQDDDPR